MLNPSHLSRLVHQWQDKKQELVRVKAEEMALRLRLVAEGFNPEIRSGTENLELKDGRILKAKKRLNYTFISQPEIERVLVEMEQVGPEGLYVTQRVVKWSATLVIGEYHKLPQLQPNGERYRAMLDSVLIITDATPELECK